MPKETKDTYRRTNNYSTRGSDSSNYPLKQRSRQHRDDRGNRPLNRQRTGYEDSYSDLDTSSLFVQHKKKILVALGIAGVVLAIGIVAVITSPSKVQIVNVIPATLPAQQPYQKCGEIETTRYSRNHKNGTEGALIGGTGGAVVGGLVSHSWVGVGVGAAVGAVGGDLVQRSHQADYVAHHSSSTQCETAYRQIQVPIGYQVSYLSSKDEVVQITTQHQPQLGSKVDLQQLETDVVTPEQQKLLVEQAIKSSDPNQAAN